jgi:hypothetical protein
VVFVEKLGGFDGFGPRQGSREALIEDKFIFFLDFV